MSFLRTLLIAFVVLAAGLLVVGYLGGLKAGGALTWPGRPAETSDTVERARQRGAAIGEQAAIATEKAEDALNEAALTAKIKAKMALDDVVKARAIDVTTRGSTVTLSGTVESKAEHDRAMSLARDTVGVTQVVDDLHSR